MNSFHWFKKRSKRPIRVVCVCMCVRTCRVEPSAFVRGEGLVETHHKKKKGKQSISRNLSRDFDFLAEKKENLLPSNHGCEYRPRRGGAHRAAPFSMQRPTAVGEQHHVHTGTESR